VELSDARPPETAERPEKLLVRADARARPTDSVTCTDLIYFARRDIL